jgi:hypothetical protein
MLPTKLGSFGQAVSKEKIFVGIDQLLKKEIKRLLILDPLTNMASTGNSCC